MLNFARQEEHSEKWSQRGRCSMSQARPLGSSQVPHSEGVSAGRGEKRGREQIYISRERGQVPGPNLPGANAPPPLLAALATPRPSARGPGNAQPTSQHAGPPASFPRRSPRPARPRPRKAPPPRSPGRGSRPRSGARASSSPPTPSPAARTLCPAPRGSRGQSGRGGSRPAAAGCAPAPPGSRAAAAAQREAACPTPATGRRWLRQATGAALPRARCCSAPRGRGHRAGRGAAAGQANTSCQKYIPAAWRGPLCVAVGGRGRTLWDQGIR